MKSNELNGKYIAYFESLQNRIGSFTVKYHMEIVSSSLLKKPSRHPRREPVTSSDLINS